MTFYVPTDPDYLRAKRIKQGATRIDPRYNRFVEQFHDRYGISPLTISLDSTDRPRGEGTALRLAVVLERTEEYRSFVTRLVKYEKVKQTETAGLLVETVSGQTLLSYFNPPRGRLGSAPRAEDIFVCFVDFEKVAKHEVHDLATDAELERFESSLGLADQFWCTERYSGPPIVFVQTYEQAQALRASPLRLKWADTYYEIAKRYDEFGYLNRAEIEIEVDSKENFEKNYSGKWWIYFK